MQVGNDTEQLWCQWCAWWCCAWWSVCRLLCQWYVCGMRVVCVVCVVVCAWFVRGVWGGTLAMTFSVSVISTSASSSSPLDLADGLA